MRGVILNTGILVELRTELSEFCHFNFVECSTHYLEICILCIINFGHQENKLGKVQFGQYLLFIAGYSLFFIGILTLKQNYTLLDSYN